MTEWSCGLLVFCKAPIAGEVKTRLIPALTAEEAAALHQALTLRTLETATAAFTDVELWCAPALEHAFFSECRSRFAVELHLQRGADLGMRMHDAFVSALTRYQSAVVIGTDCPCLSAADLRAARGALQQGAQAVLGPADDGGYVLLGLRRVCPELFTDIPWGSGSVAGITRARLRRLGWGWSELACRSDVDTPADLFRWRRLQVAPPDGK